MTESSDPQVGDVVIIDFRWDAKLHGATGVVIADVDNTPSNKMVRLEHTARRAGTKQLFWSGYLKVIGDVR